MENPEKLITSTDIRAKATYKELFSTWEENLTANLPIIKKNKTVWDLPTNHTPAICVGAGPSLLKNRRLLKKLYIRYNNMYCKNCKNPQKCSTIICSDAALPMIKDYKIPTYVVSANAEQTITKNGESEVMELHKCCDTTNIGLISPVNAHPDTFKEWKGEIYFYVPTIIPPNVKETIESLNIKPLITGSNEGLIAYMLCVFMGHNPVAMIGMDYSFKTKKECKNKTFGDALIETTDINGQKVWTNMLWFDSTMEFFQIARTFYKKGLITVNCTEGGILYDRFIGPDGQPIIPSVIFKKTLKEFVRLPK